MSGASARQRLPRFLVVGAWNTAVGYLVFVGIALAAGDRLHHQVVLVLSFAVSVVHAYAMQRLLVFRTANAVAPEFARFVAVNLAALAVNAVLLEALVRLGMGVIPAQLVATFGTTLLSFVAHQAWSFKSRS